MNTHPSISRYQSARSQLERYPANRDGQKMNMEHIDAPELGGHVGASSFIDNNPESVDIVRLVTDSKKGSYKAETFLEVPPKRNWWGTPKGNQQLVHLSRQVQHVAGGYNLGQVALTTVDLVTGEEMSTVTGKAAVRGAQQLQEEIPYRIHTIDPKGMERQEENWLVS
jgi:phage-related protein